LEIGVYSPSKVLARSISGRVLRPGDPGFAALALPYNLREASVQPAGIARCRSAKDVATSIKWARKYHYPLIARSGGHSAGDYSVTTGLMIDTKLMNQTSFNSKTGIATVGGGTLNTGVYEALSQNDVTITHGRCPTVGAAGFLLGGGIGFNTRRLGVGSDALVASQLVTAADYLQQYYATNLPRLERIKAAVDPTRVFNFPQAIPPRGRPVHGW
jgi:FAD/FMN-containing dehydrogenase